MTERMTRERMLASLKQGREQWDALVARFTDEQMRQPLFADGWSLKDILAHVTWYEREMIGVIKARALVGSELWDLPTDERNIPIYKTNKDKSLEAVKAEAVQVYEALYEAAATLSDDDLNDARSFADMPEDWVPWEVIAGNSFEHYQQHIPELQAWLDENQD